MKATGLINPQLPNTTSTLRMRQGLSMSPVGVVVRIGFLSSAMHSQWKRAIMNSSISQFESTLMTSVRSEEHTSELQSLMRISYAVFCLKKKKYKTTTTQTRQQNHY